MDYRKFSFTNNNVTIHHTKEIYHKSASGRSWKRKPDETTRETITAQNYTNYVTSIPFFNGFFGGTCRAEMGYTPAGYIPVKITTISPDRAEKHYDYFTFIYNY